MQFALENDSPIIADEKYFKNPSYYEKQGAYPFQNIVNGKNTIFDFPKPTDQSMRKLKKIPFTEKEVKKIMDKYPSIEIGCQEILAIENKEYTKNIIEKIEKIEKQYGKIEAILSWTWYKSLEVACKKKNIPLIQLELSTFRFPSYQIKLGYFQFYDKYDSQTMDQDYLKFLEEKKIQKFFSRKELLGMFLNKQYLSYLNRLNEQPKYEFGVNIGPLDPLERAKCHTDEDKQLEEIQKMIKLDEMTLRIHPVRRKDTDKFNKYQIDHSANSIEWILQNRRIISTGSNIAFETLLLGRTAYVIGDNFPYRYGSVSTLDNIEEKICDISYLNYIIFCYYAPFDLMFDSQYIHWRLTKPSMTEIYEYHLDYILKKYKIQKDIFQLNNYDRLIEIISKTKEMSKSEIEKILKDTHYLPDENMHLRNLLAEEKKTMNEILNSKSWKITSPLRKISKRLHRKTS